MSNLSEFCYGVTTINEYFGPCRNPWNLERIPGGSSGGSAAAVAAGMCRIAFGTDTGGSVRIPAALCGVAGLRPTVGRVPNTGGLGLTTNFDAAGPLAYDVADVAAGYMAIAGYDADDPNSVNRPVEDPLTTLGAGIAGMRIGIPKTFFFDNLAEDVARMRGESHESFRVVRRHTSRHRFAGRQRRQHGRYDHRCRGSA